MLRTLTPATAQPQRVPLHPQHTAPNESPPDQLDGQGLCSRQATPWAVSVCAPGLQDPPYLPASPQPFLNFLSGSLSFGSTLNVAHSSPPLTCALRSTTIYLFIGDPHVCLSFQTCHWVPDPELNSPQDSSETRVVAYATCPSPKEAPHCPPHACPSLQALTLEMALPFPSPGTSSSQAHPSSRASLHQTTS